MPHRVDVRVIARMFDRDLIVGSVDLEEHGFGLNDLVFVHVHL